MSYIAVDDKINAVLASGKANELDRISRLIDDLTITIMDSEAEFRRYELKEADPEGLAKALLDIYARPEKTVIEDGKPTKVPQPPKIVAVAGSRAPVLSLSGRNHWTLQFIEQIIEGTWTCDRGATD